MTIALVTDSQYRIVGPVNPHSGYMADAIIYPFLDCSIEQYSLSAFA